MKYEDSNSRRELFGSLAPDEVQNSEVRWEFSETYKDRTTNWLAGELADGRLFVFSWEVWRSDREMYVMAMGFGGLKPEYTDEVAAGMAERLYVFTPPQGMEEYLGREFCATYLPAFGSEAFESLKRHYRAYQQGKVLERRMVCGMSGTSCTADDIQRGERDLVSRWGMGLYSREA